MTPYQPGADQGSVACARCAESLGRGRAYLLGDQVRCLRCSLLYAPLLRRSAVTALVIGTILVVINQGTILLDDTATAALLWKIPLTYVVPFCVATWGALSNSRR